MNQEIQNNFIVEPFKASLIMERKNDIPFEHQMMFVLRRYDSVMAENIELRKEIEELTEALEELTEALEELGGNNERKSLKKRIKKLSEKNESLKQKLSEKNNQYDEVYRLYKMVSKKKNVLKNTLLYVKAHINKMLALVDVPALKLLSQRIAKDVNLVEHTNCVYEEVQ